MINKRKAGDLGEELAVAFLLEKGYSIIEKNFRSKVGEIDIIAKKDGVITFVEVKSRSGLLWGSPSEAVNIKKQNKIIKVAKQYLQQKGQSNEPCCFDVIEVLDNKESVEINHIVNAFAL